MNTQPTDTRAPLLRLHDCAQLVQDTNIIFNDAISLGVREAVLSVLVDLTKEVYEEGQ